MKKNIIGQKNQWSVRLVNLAILAVFAIAGFVLSFFCSENLTEEIFVKYKTLISVVMYSATALLFVLGVIFYFVELHAWHKLSLIVFLLYDFILVMFLFLLSSGFFQVVQSPERFQEYLESSGALMPVLFIVLQFLQVVILPIPSNVTLTAGTLLFGSWNGFLYSYFSIVLGSITAFFIGRWLGYRAVAWIVGEDTLQHWLKKIKGKDNFLITAMFILPFFPDDVICFIAGLSNMTGRFFIIMVIICRAIFCASYCFPLGFLSSNPVVGIVLWAVIFLIGAIAFWLFCKYQDQIGDWVKRHNPFGKKR